MREARAAPVRSLRAAADRASHASVLKFSGRVLEIEVESRDQMAQT
jgi:hypothetical protein